MGLSWFWSAWALVVLPGTGLRQAQPIVPAIAACSLLLTRTILFSKWNIMRLAFVGLLLLTEAIFLHRWCLPW